MKYLKNESGDYSSDIERELSSEKTIGKYLDSLNTGYHNVLDLGKNVGSAFSKGYHNTLDFSKGLVDDTVELHKTGRQGVIDTYRAGERKVKELGHKSQDLWEDTVDLYHTGKDKVIDTYRAGEKRVKEFGHKTHELWDDTVDLFKEGKDKVVNHYQRHKELYDAIGTVGAGIGAAMLAGYGLHSIGADHLIAEGIHNLGHYSDLVHRIEPYAHAIGHGATAFTAAALAKVPAKWGFKKYVLREQPHKGERRKETAEEFGRETALETAKEIAGEGLYYNVLAGFPISVSDVIELGKGIGSEIKPYWENSKSAIKDKWQTRFGRKSESTGYSEADIDTALAKISVKEEPSTIDLSNYMSHKFEKAGDYVDRLIEGRNSKGFSF